MGFFADTKYLREWEREIRYRARPFTAEDYLKLANIRFQTAQKECLERKIEILERELEEVKAELRKLEE